jgi:hypothetical protein
MRSSRYHAHVHRLAKDLMTPVWHLDCFLRTPLGLAGPTGGKLALESERPNRRTCLTMTRAKAQAGTKVQGPWTQLRPVPPSSERLNVTR